MGTRGFITFVADGEEKTTYQQFDSYPSGVGLTVLYQLRDIIATHNEAVARLRTDVRNLRVVTEKVPPTPEQFDDLREWLDHNVNRYDENGVARETPSWYQLLRKTQGDPREILAAGYLLDASDFPADSLFAEWGYVIDLDDGDLEVYTGFQKTPHDVGRFAKMPLHQYPSGSMYYPVKRIAAWPLDELPTDQEFVAACQRGAELSGG